MKYLIKKKDLLQKQIMLFFSAKKNKSIKPMTKDKFV
jgi:hypothetical protein